MAENIKFKDSDILKNMEYLNDYESIVYGANGHYANSAFYNLNKNYTDSDNVGAVEELKKESGIDENLEKSIWMIH